MREKYKTDLTGQMSSGQKLPRCLSEQETENGKSENWSMQCCILWITAANGEPCHMISRLIQQYTVFIAVRD